jgi:sulfur-oxidizing protein SoxY
MQDDMDVPTRLTRRDVLALTAAAASVPLLMSLATPAVADAAEAQRRIAAFAGGRDLQEGRVTITIADVAENGNAVPVAVEVDSAMEGEDRVETIMLVAEANPLPDVVSVHFTPLSGTARFATRMRLAQSQTVTALVRMADGSVHVGRKAVTVTVGGCTG